MDLEASLSGEQLVTGGALVVLNPRVGLDVGGQRAFHCEGSETLGALVRLLMGVDANVSHEITGLFKLFTAVGTLMPPNSIHLCLIRLTFLATTFTKSFLNKFHTLSYDIAVIHILKNWKLN